MIHWAWLIVVAFGAFYLGVVIMAMMVDAKADGGCQGAG